MVCSTLLLGVSVSFQYERTILLIDILRRVILWLTISRVFCCLLCSKDESTTLWLIILLTLVFSFLTQTLMMYYIIFELSLVPISIMILFYGRQPERISARLYILMYTMVFRTPFLLVVVQFLPRQLFDTRNALSISFLIGLLLLLPFLVKIPIIGLHFWLPKAHVEARTRGSMILAGVLLKLGSYGLARVLRLRLGLIRGKHILLWGICSWVASLVTLIQSDVKKLVAYRRVVHMTFLILGVLSFNKIIIRVVILMSVAHAWASILIFYLAGLFSTASYSRLTSLIGVDDKLTWKVLGLGIGLILNASIPPTLAFVSELLLVIIIIKSHLRRLLLFTLLRFTVGYYNVFFFVNLLQVKKENITDINIVVRYHNPRGFLLLLSFVRLLIVLMF